MCGARMGFGTGKAHLGRGVHAWPCADEKVSFRTYVDSRVLRGMELEEYCQRIVDLPYLDSVVYIMPDVEEE
jgi:hypothetical protein